MKRAPFALLAFVAAIRKCTPGNGVAIYEEELQQFWPLDLQNREAEIERFAKQHRFKLRFYKRGLCAIFQVRLSYRVIEHSAKLAQEHTYSGTRLLPLN